MAVLSYKEMYTYARGAGFDNNTAIMFAAFGQAESGGRTDVVNSIGCVGIWQINQPVHVKSNPTWTKTWLKNPRNNAIAAKKIYDSQGLGAWEVYTGPDGRGSDGPWLKYKAAAEKAIGAGSATVDQAGFKPDFNPFDENPLDELRELNEDAKDSFMDATGLGQVADAINAIGTTAVGASQWMSNPHNWVRVVFVVAGGALVIGGLYIMSQPLVNQAAGALPVGKIAKAIK